MNPYQGGVYLTTRLVILRPQSQSRQQGGTGSEKCTNRSNMSFEAVTNEKLLELSRYHVGEVNNHRIQLAALSRAINSRIPALSLPDELVLRIFLLYRDLSPVIDTESRWSMHTYGAYKPDTTKWWWLVPGQICHSWRAIVLANPLLWRYVNSDIFSRHHVLDATISRSCKAPLDISISCGIIMDNVAGHSGRKILKESYRIRRLHLSMPQSRIDHHLTDEVNLRPFMILEDLEIILDIPLVGAAGDVAALTTIVPSIPSSLRILNLHGVSISWEMFKGLPPTLTSMTIAFPPRSPPGTCEDILDALHRLPCLERLHLTEVPMGPQPTKKTATLPYLKDLHITQSDSWNVLLVVQGLSFPPNIQSHLSVGFKSEDPVPPVSLYSILPKFRLLTSPEGKIMNASLNFDPDDDGESILSIEACIPSNCIGPGVWHRSFCFSLATRDVAARDASPWVDLLEAASINIYPHVNGGISFEGCCFLFATDLLARTLVRAKEVEKLKIDHIAAALCLPDIICVSPDDTVPIPKLQKVTVSSIRPMLDFMIDGDDLCEALEERQEKGCPLERLKINGPHTIQFNSPDAQQRLGELVNFILA
ncbi:hypothetical protein QCA50_005203 [Cerrena zonata]|uniref:F-box domain-containing protein n=1 Tax=Cerrena zonata TaxID=2478898 RepID=A0AAW0GES7_9APHY